MAKGDERHPAVLQPLLRPWLRLVTLLLLLGLLVGDVILVGVVAVGACVRVRAQEPVLAPHGHAEGGAPDARQRQNVLWGWDAPLFHKPGASWHTSRQGDGMEGS